MGRVVPLPDEFTESDLRDVFHSLGPGVLRIEISPRQAAQWIKLASPTRVYSVGPPKPEDDLKDSDVVVAFDAAVVPFRVVCDLPPGKARMVLGAVV